MHQGRKKIEIKKIKKDSNRQVTFSKRRIGLFKKANELCVLTGSEIAIMVESPGGRVFASGVPSVDYIVNRYITNGNVESNQKPKILAPTQINEFNQHYMKLSKELEEEENKNNVISESNGLLWWNKGIDGLGVEELEEFVKSLEGLKKKVVTRADELTMIRNSNSSFEASLNPKQVVEFGNNQNNTVYSAGNSSGQDFESWNGNSEFGNNSFGLDFQVGNDNSFGQDFGLDFQVGNDNSFGQDSEAVDMDDYSFALDLEPDYYFGLDFEAHNISS